jgi:histone acetyltransferase (RNA polymerase elongator complex component)
MDARLADLESHGIVHLEAAFYGGSFTGLPFELQRRYLGQILPYKETGRIKKIRLSTRPDYINENVISLLQEYSVDIVELGVQSFNEDVLLQSSRGHTAQQTLDACRLLRRHGFQLGIQLMIGLPGDSKESAIRSAENAVEIRPDFVRIYPVSVLDGSQLAEMYKNGLYSPPTTDEAVDIAKEMVRIFNRNKIQVIRIGLKSTDNINASTDLSGCYHPSFRQLVESALAYEDMAAQLGASAIVKGQVAFSANSKSFSNLIGYKAANKKRLAEEYPQVFFVYKVDDTLADHIYAMSSAHQ